MHAACELDASLPTRGYADGSHARLLRFQGLAAEHTGPAHEEEVCATRWRRVPERFPDPHRQQIARKVVHLVERFDIEPFSDLSAK